jgi:hypothetical protein
MKENMAKDATDSVSIGCGYGDANALELASTETSASRTDRRRLQHVQDASYCNNSTNMFCWMQCIEIPDYKQAQGYLNEGYSLYCLDPNILAASSNRVSAATPSCKNGYVHNPYCAGSWQPTAPGVTAIDVKVASSAASSSVNEQWCYGSTSMYMDGFHWRSTVCIIFLFPQWILSSRAKVVGASIGTLIFAMALELGIHQRRMVVTSMKAGHGRLAASAALYTLQLTMGYMLMLLIMTYSAPLFVCVVLGLVCGHVLWNAKDALLVRDTATPCGAQECVEDCPQECAIVGDPLTMIKHCPCEQRAAEEQAGVPEGLTPCCQNTL